MYVFTKEKVNPSAFQQSTLWYDGEGMPHLIKDLPYSYAKNIISKLHKMGLYNNNSATPLVKALKARMQEAKSAIS